MKSFFILNFKLAHIVQLINSLVIRSLYLNGDFYLKCVANNDHVNKPKVQSATGSYGTQGEQLTLNCSVDIRKGVLFTMNWKLPNDNISMQVRKLGFCCCRSRRVQIFRFIRKIGWSNQQRQKWTTQRVLNYRLDLVPSRSWTSTSTRTKATTNVKWLIIQWIETVTKY